MLVLNRKILPKIVTSRPFWARMISLLSCTAAAAVFLGCHHGGTPANSGDLATVSQAGINSVTGKALTSSNWCSDPPLADENGVVHMMHFKFQNNAQFVIDKYAVQDDGKLKLQGEDVGTFSIVNDRIYLKHKNDLVTRQLVSLKRTTDGATCYHLVSNDGNNQLICACLIK